VTSHVHELGFHFGDQQGVETGTQQNLRRAFSSELGEDALPTPPERPEPDTKPFGV
jgi:hypothetical protein